LNLKTKMPEVPKVKLIRQIIIGLVCLLFLVSPVFSFAADTQLELQMAPFPAPTNLTATVVGSNQIDLSWSAVSEAANYKVYRGGVLVASPTTTSYSDTGVGPGITYSYTVSAVNIDGAESPQGSPISVTIPTGGGGMPAAWFNPPAPPAGGFAILINNGDEYTNNPIVTLTLKGGSNTERMAISNFSDFRDAGQEAYTTSKTWDLCKGQTSCPGGEYIVYAKFYTSWGTASEVISDKIIYKKKPITELTIEQIKEISKKIADLRKQIAQLFKKEVVAEVPKAPPEEIVPKETPPEEITPPAEELPEEEIITPPKKEVPPEKEKVGIIDFFKEYGKWLWQKITNFWQKIWPF